MYDVCSFTKTINVSLSCSFVYVQDNAVAEGTGLQAYRPLVPDDESPLDFLKIP